MPNAPLASVPSAPTGTSSNGSVGVSSPSDDLRQSPPVIANPDSAAAERVGAPPVITPETRSTATLSMNFRGKARFGVLYFQDQPAHRDRVIQYLKDKGAEILFHSPALGYVDAEIPWSALSGFIKGLSTLGIEDSLLKLELEDWSLASGTSNPAPEADSITGSSITPDSSYLGAVHSAGYGAKIAEFKQAVASHLGVSISVVQGQGSLVAVYDSGMDVSRTDVFGSRLRDFHVGDEREWREATLSLQEWKSKRGITLTPPGLGDWEQDSSLRIFDLEESEFSDDLNGSGSRSDFLSFAVVRRASGPLVRVLPHLQLQAGFGPAFEDYSVARNSGKPATVDLWTGRPYSRPALGSTLGLTLASQSPSAAVFKFRIKDDKVQLAILGVKTGAEHGIANLHMVGGDVSVPQDGGLPAINYRGVAPKTDFLVMQPWRTHGGNYGDGWIPLARSMIQAVEAGADVLDLDIFTPGTRRGADLLSRLACRIVNQSRAVPVVAVHNYGPLPQSIQSLAQSPCVLGIGASHSRAALKYGRNQASVDPRLGNSAGHSEDSVQTANYSGRGLGMNGLLKPDLIAPAYGYTAYGARFTRFAGTSGATPTTAGAIALLKQAARAKGIELSYYDVKFLLQSSSSAVFDPESGLDAGKNYRDGYGNLNLLKAWQLLLKLSSNQSLSAAPLAMKGWRLIQAESSSSISLISLEWTREGVLGGSTAPEPMRFWFEGDPEVLSRLQFFDVNDGHLTRELVKDIPLVGETQSTRLSLDVGGTSWERIPPGDHQAVLKGLRVSLWNRLSPAERARAADYLQPIILSKGRPLQERLQLVSRPLYADQVQNFELQGRPGDLYWLRGEVVCQADGERNETPAAGAVSIYADGEQDVGSAYQLPNGYAPGVLGAQPLQVKSTRELVRVGIARRSQSVCPGPVVARIRVDHLSLSDESRVTSIRLRDTRINVEAQTRLSPQGMGWNVEDGLVFSRTLKARSEPAFVKLIRDYTESMEWVIPPKTRRVRVIASQPARFQGGIAIQKGSSWEWLAHTETQSAGGLGSEWGRKSGQWLGLEALEPEAGKRLRVEATGGYRVEFWMDLPEADKIEFQATGFPASGLSRWEMGDGRLLTVKGDFSATRSASLSDFKGPDWLTSVVVPYLIEETPVGGEAEGDYRYLRQEFYRAQIEFGIPVN
jgi:subtilisin family serine protease